MTLLIPDAIKRLEAQAEDVISKVHKADDGTFSWPMDEWSVVFVPLGHYDSLSDYGVLQKVTEDEQLTMGTTYVFREVGLIKALSVAIPVHEALTTTRNVMSTFISSALVDPTGSAPNLQDIIDFEHALKFND